MRVAVLGAGVTGMLAALDLAEAGIAVDLYDREPAPFRGASLAAEGKIHLGYVYAHDRSLRTARTMVAGAAAFRPLVARWTGEALFRSATSTPFVYGVARDSQVGAAAFRAYGSAVSALIAAQPGLPPEAAAFREMTNDERAATFDPDAVVAAFATGEIAVDTAQLGAALVAAAQTAPNLALRMGIEVIAVVPQGEGAAVTVLDSGTAMTERYDAVINALWQDRLHVDAGFGLPADRPIIHRYKFGMFSQRAAAMLPSVTLVLGLYGDTVGFADNAYLSWYPVGHLSTRRDIRPGPPPAPGAAERAQIITGMLDQLGRMIPAVRALPRDPAAYVLRGGWITAWGRTGIDDPGSELHERHAVGVHSTGCYHSVDTGKLSLGPFFAAEAARRIRARA